MVARVDFRIAKPFASQPPGIEPFVDGVSLVDLIAGFEAPRAYTAGFYGPLVPAFRNFGDVRRYYHGLLQDGWDKPGQAWLLGCDCGDPACWPLEARVSVDAHRVCWFDFDQPHRPSWDYGDFGPFEFDRVQYHESLIQALLHLRALRSRGR